MNLNETVIQTGITFPPTYHSLLCMVTSVGEWKFSLMKSPSIHRHQQIFCAWNRTLSKKKDIHWIAYLVFLGNKKNNTQKILSFRSLWHYCSNDFLVIKDTIMGILFNKNCFGYVAVKLNLKLIILKFKI